MRAQASGGLLGQFKSIFNLSEMPGPDSKNPSPNDVTKDIASRLKTGGEPGFAEIDMQSPGARPGVRTPRGSRQCSVDKPAQAAY